VTSGYRSFAEQNTLFAQGRTAPGPRVTNASGGQSWHNFGLALDVVEIRTGDDGRQVAIWDGVDANWSLIGDIGKYHGFEWGGDWISFIDRPHFEMRFGYTLAQLRAKRENGEMEDGFVMLNN